MCREQNATQWVDRVVQGQVGAGSRRKITRRAQSGRLGERCDRPLNVLGCLALIHAVRSVNSAGRVRAGSRRTAAA